MAPLHQSHVLCTQTSVIATGQHSIPPLRTRGGHWGTPASWDSPIRYNFANTSYAAKHLI
jgi:hypothetical protein